MKGYIALVHKDEGTSYGVSFPDVPGCIAAGDTFEEAVAFATEALAFHFASTRADGDPIPVPRSYDELKRDPEFLADASGAIVTMDTGGLRSAHPPCAFVELRLRGHRLRRHRNA